MNLPKTQRKDLLNIQKSRTYKKSAGGRFFSFLLKKVKTHIRQQRQDWQDSALVHEPLH